MLGNSRAELEVGEDDREWRIQREKTTEVRWEEGVVEMKIGNRNEHMFKF